MKNTTSIWVVSSIILLQATSVWAKSDIYYYLDEKGRPVYSDIKPQKAHQTRELKPVNQVKWVKSNPVTMTKASKSGGRTSEKSLADEKSSNCKKLERKIQTIERKLEGNLRAESFDHFKRELSEMRWQKHQSC